MVGGCHINRIDAFAVDQFAEVAVHVASIVTFEHLRVVSVHFLFGGFGVLGIDVADGNDLLIGVGVHPIQVPAGPVASAADESHHDSFTGCGRAVESPGRMRERGAAPRRLSLSAWPTFEGIVVDCGVLPSCLVSRL